MGLVSLGSFIFLIGNMCLYSKKKIDEVISLGFMVLILLLYPLGMVKRLSGIGVVLLFIDLILFCIYIYRYSFKAYLKEMRNYIFTFGALVFLCIVICVCCFGYGRRVCFHDEFVFWATAIKTLWHYNGFATAVEVWAIWEYPQGMQLLEWFGSFLTGGYTEWMFYAIRLIFNFSMLMPLFKNFKFKWYYAPLAAILTILFPSMFNSTSYIILSVDGDLAFLYGYMLYCILDREDINFFYYFRIFLCESVIVLTKSFSIVFIIYGWLLLIALIMYEKKHKLNVKRVWNSSKNTIMLGAVFILPLLVLKSWSWFLNYIGYTSTKVTGRASGFVNAFLQGTWQWTGYEDDIVRTFFRCFFTHTLSNWQQKSRTYSTGIMTPFILTVLILIAIALLARKKYIAKNRAYLLQGFWLFMVGTYSVLFIVSHCTLFVGEIQKYTNHNLLAVSLGRYCAPVYWGGGLAFVLCVLSRIRQVNIKYLIDHKFISLFCIVSIILGCNYYALFRCTQIFHSVDDEMEAIYEPIDEMPDSWVNNLKPGQERVYCLTGKNIDPAQIYTLVPIVLQKPDLYYPIYGIGDLQNYLYQWEFHYIYYANDTAPQILLDICNQMLPENETMEIGGLYEIDMSEVRFRLNRVNVD